MTTDDLQLLRDFRRTVPEPDEDTVRRAYAYATSQSRTARRLHLRLPASYRVRIAGVAAVAGAAALIGFFAVPSSSPQRPVTTVTTIPRAGDLAIPMPISQALSVASKSFGVSVFLPDTSVLKPSDAERGYLQWLPASQPGEQTPVSQLDVAFSKSAPAVTVEYAPTGYTPCGPTDEPCSTVYPNALDQYKAEIAQGSQSVDGRTPPTYQIVYLSDGTPALSSTGRNGNDIEFRVGPLSINIWAPSNDGVPTTVSAADLQALAQSIVDQSNGNGS